jgi:hypothetical protein
MVRFWEPRETAGKMRGRGTKLDSRHRRQGRSSLLAARVRFTATVVVPLMVVTSAYVLIREYEPASDAGPQGYAQAGELGGADADAD